jgi:hypothetical protein
MILGLSLALASALATNVAFLLKYRGAVLASPVRARHPLGSAAALFRSKWFAVGWLVAVLAWLLHAGALALAPLSIVQAVLSGGLVFLAVLAERFFGFHLGRWQLVRRHHHGGRAARHRTHRRRRDSTAALLTGGADRRRGARSSRSAPRCWRSQPTAASCTVPKDCCSACPPVRCSASPMSPSVPHPRRTPRRTGS